MNTILIATDFSAASHNAVVYGIELARFLKAKVVLLHVCQPILSEGDMETLMTEEEIIENSEALIRNELKQVKGAEALDVEIVVEEGLPSETIEWVAKNVNASWIVAGMKGGCKMMRKIFGSTAISLTRNSSIPLVIVPEHAIFNAPKTIALAKDIKLDVDAKVLEPLEEICSLFNSTIFVVSVVKEQLDPLTERLARQKELKCCYTYLNPSFKFLNDSDVAHAINGFVEEHNVEMVAIVAHEHNVFERVFMKSEAEEMLFRSHIPLLILRSKVAGEFAHEHEDHFAVGSL
jgi:nucleotide-binding universal stress UspA family protein